MIDFRIKNKRFYLFWPYFEGSTSTSSNGWSKMRWIVVGPAVEKEILEKISHEKDPSWDQLNYVCEIDDRRLIQSSTNDGVSLAELDVLWNLAGDLFMSQLWSIRLEESFQRSEVSEWINQQLNTVRQPIIEKMKHRSLAERSADSTEHGWTTLANEIQVTLSAIKVVPPDYVQQFLLLLLDNVFWFLLGQFEDKVDVDTDLMIASLWFGPRFADFLESETPHGLRFESC